LNSDFVYRLLFLVADAAPGGANPAPAGPGPDFMNFLPLIALLFLVYYLMVLRPQQKGEQKKRQELLNNLKKNDRVVTIGGIYGVVMNVKRESDEVVLKIDESNDTKIRVIFNAIARVIPAEGAEEAKAK
jgi:preprotein translocase subunit YajC